MKIVLSEQYFMLNDDDVSDNVFVVFHCETTCKLVLKLKAKFVFIALFM